MVRMKTLKNIRLEAGLSLRKAGAPRFAAPTVRVYENDGSQLLQIRYLAQLRQRCGITWSELGRRIDEELREEGERDPVDSACHQE